MARGTSCREWSPYGSTNAILRAGREEFPSFPDSVLRNAPQLPFEHELCRVWSVPRGPAAQRERVYSDVPTLVISGTFDSIDALAHGDATPIATLWAGIKLSPEGIGVLGNGLFYGVSCGEWVPYESEADVVAAGRRAFPTFPLSVHRNAPNLQFMRSNCAVWNVPPVSPSVRDVTESDIPTLVVSAQYDAQTASSFGPLVARTLPNATVVEIPNIAHVAFGSPSDEAKRCAQEIVRDYFEVLGEVDTSCTTRVPPTDFVITPR